MSKPLWTTSDHSRTYVGQSPHALKTNVELVNRSKSAGYETWLNLTFTDKTLQPNHPTCEPQQVRFAADPRLVARALRWAADDIEAQMEYELLRSELDF